MKLISITGTKGKTTITRALSYIIKNSGENTLRVDTDGHYINERQKSTLQDSRNLFTKAPTVCAGKYLITMKKYFPNFTAILESSIGSNGINGLGYSFHNIGIFTNVFEDHLGLGKLKTKTDLANSKSFIFKRIGDNGFAVFNADDKYVCSQLKKISTKRKITLLPVGINLKYFNEKKHLLNGGELITLENNFIVIKSKNRTKRIIDVTEINWTFNGFFLPSLYNLMFIIGGIYSFNNKRITKQNLLSIKKYRLEKNGGRLTLLQNKKNIKILVDYAHEKYSLREVAKLGGKLKKNSTGHILGIVRLAPDRTNDVIFETGAFISNHFDDIIVYDKIDGVNRDRFVGKNCNFTREIGEVSKIFTEGILKNKNKGLVENILVEENAIKRASQISKSGDVIIVICGDDHK